MVKRKTMTFYCYYIFFGPKNKKGKKKKKHNKSLFTLLCTSQIVHFFYLQDSVHWYLEKMETCRQ